MKNEEVEMARNSPKSSNMNAISALELAPAMSLIFLMLLGAASFCHARAVQSEDLDTLIRKADRIVIGKIKTVVVTDLQKRLHYPTLREIPFVWHRTEVEVMEGFKNSVKGDSISMLFLRTVYVKRSPPVPIINGPQSLGLAAGDRLYLMFLRRTSETNSFCAYTEPYDPVCSVFELGQTNWVTETVFQNRLPGLFTATGSLAGEGITQFRKYCDACLEQGSERSTPLILGDDVQVNQYGWETDSPDEHTWWTPTTEAEQSLSKEDEAKEMERLWEKHKAAYYEHERKLMKMRSGTGPDANVEDERPWWIPQFTVSNGVSKAEESAVLHRQWAEWKENYYEQERRRMKATGTGSASMGDD